MTRSIAVIGAGIAGASIAHALTQRGHHVTVVDAAAEPASGASGNLAGVFRPLPSRDDSRLSRLLRAGFELGHQQFATLAAAYADMRCGWTGALHIARDDAHENTQRAIAAVLSAPTFCRYVDRTEASALAGWPVEQGGWWFAEAGWINPPSLVRALLAGIDCRYGQTVARLAQVAGQPDAVWQLFDADDKLILSAADVVLANAIGAPALVPHFKLPIRAGRGLVSLIPESATPSFEIVATRLGYVTPAIDGLRCAGATMAADDLDAAPRLADHIENLHRLDILLPGFGKDLDPAQLAGRVSFRPMSPDRLPIVGPLAANDGLWIINGFGARGLVFAPICAALLASQISGAALPLAADLVAALAPARFSQTTRMAQSAHSSSQRNSKT